MKKLILINSLAFVLGFGSHAETNMVTNLDDSGAGSLREAIELALPGNTIEFQVTGTVSLTSRELVINKDLVIAGPGPDVVCLDGNNTNRIFRVISGNVTISGLTLTNGLAQGQGGGASPDNPAAGGGGGGAGMGGAIYVAGGSVTLANVVLVGNMAKGGKGGDAGLYTLLTGGTGGVGGGPAGGAGGTNDVNGDGLTGTAGGWGSGGGGGAAGTNVAGIGGQGGFGGGGGGGGGIIQGGAGAMGGTGPSFGGPGRNATESGAGGGGGGGAGLGGAIFVETGTLSMLEAVAFRNNTATGGQPGELGSSVEPGQGKGGALFVHTGAIATGAPQFIGNQAQNAGGTAFDNNCVYGSFLSEVTFNIPNTGPVLISAVPIPLQAFAAPLGGTFTGPGVTDGTFYPQAAGPGVHEITYQVPNDCGYPDSAKSSIQVVACLPTLVVSNNTDSDVGSLRWAITNLCEDGVITFDPGMKGKTIELTSGQLVINQGLTITGPGESELVIDGRGNSRIFRVNQGVVRIANLTIANGFVQGLPGQQSVDNLGAGGGGGAAGLGGGMLIMEANVTLSQVSMTGNTVRGGSGAPAGVSTKEFGTGGVGGNGELDGMGGAGGVIDPAGIVIPETISPTVTSGPVVISNVVVNGGGQVAVVQPGMPINLGMSYFITNHAECAACPAQIQVGFIHQAPQVCVYDGIPGVEGVLSNGVVALTAPNQPGTYYIGFAHGSASECKSTWAGEAPPGIDHYLAAIVVPGGAGGMGGEFAGGGGGAASTNAPGTGGLGGFGGGGGGGGGDTLGGNNGAPGAAGGELGGSGQNACVGGSGGGGGGGAGLGGAIFLYEGSLTLENATLTDNSAYGGTAGATGCEGSNGKGKGGAIFNLHGTSSGTVILADNVAGDPGDTLVDNNCVYGEFTPVARITDPLNGQSVSVTNKPIDFSAAGSPPGGTYSGQGIVGNEFDPAIAEVGEHVITYTVTNECNLNASTNLTIKVTCVPDITVASLEDDGAWSLRWALRNICPEGGTIRLPGTNTLVVKAANDTAKGPSAFVIPPKPGIGANIVIEGNGAVLQGAPTDGTLRFFLVRSGSLLTLRHLTLREGTAGGADAQGGAIYNEGQLTLETTTLTANRATAGEGMSASGGAIWNEGLVSIIASTLSHNQARGGNSGSADGGWGLGGAIRNRGLLAMDNCTVSGNVAQGGNSDSMSGGSAQGGGLLNAGTFELYNCTLAYNTVAVGTGGVPEVAKGGALYNHGNVYLLNNILAYSGDDTDAVNEGGTATGHHNLAGSYSGFGNIFLGSTPDPKLGPLQDNGGPTFTHALLAGSPAIDAGENSGSVLNGPKQAAPIDQRGVQRGVFDIGAFEAHPWISVIPAVAMDEDTQTTVAFNLGDRLLLPVNPVANLTAVCSDASLVPANGLTVSSAGTNGTLLIVPALNANGTATVTVTAATTNGSMSVTFALTVNPVNDQPTLDPIADLFLIENAGQQTVGLSGITSGPTNESQTLAVTAISSNPALIPGVLVNYLSPENSGTLSFASLPDAYGNAVITVSVNDGGSVNNVITRSFTVHVNARPHVAITQPANNAVFVVQQPIDIITTAIDPDNNSPVLVDLYADNTLLGAVANGLFRWSTAAAGIHHLTAVATDSLGASATSAVVRVLVLAGPEISRVSNVDVSSPRVRQTGLFYQTVCITNNTALTFEAVRLSVGNLPAVVRLYNAAGTNAGVPYVQHNQQIQPAGAVCLELEYYASDRRTVPNPVFTAELLSEAGPAINPGTNLVALNIQQVLADKTVMLIFNTETNHTYYIQYTSTIGEESSWQTAVPGVVGNGTYIPWVDSGPPKTATHPGTVAARYYRLIQY